MGAFKPLLPFGDKTIIKTLIDTFFEARVATLIVVLGHKADLVREHLRDENLLIVINPDPEGDMASSIACGVGQLRETCEAVLITPGDLPAIGTHVVTTVVGEWEQGAQLVVPTWNQRGGHPVLVDRIFFSELMRLNATGLRGFFSSHSSQVKRIPVKSPFIARDLDTWDDYRELHKEIFGKVPPDTCS